MVGMKHQGVSKVLQQILDLESVAKLPEKTKGQVLTAADVQRAR